MALALRYAARSDVGLLRDGNEDSGYASPGLLAVADGMGGHAAGEVASSIAIATLADLDQEAASADPLDRLAAAVRGANAHLRDMVAGDPDLGGMGTTLTALLKDGSRFGLVHIGDSRCYLLREGELQQITRDHTFVQTLIDEGRISESDADQHPQRSLILRALDGRDDVEPDLSIREVRVGDRYLICSDGLSGVVSEQTLRETMAAAKTPERAVEQLVDLALRGGGPDNITAIIADVVEVDDDPLTSLAPVTVGAAAEEPVRRADADTPAAKAAALAPDENEAADADDAAYDVEARRGGGRSPRRGVGAFVIVLFLLGLTGAAVVAWQWSQTQFYVGADNEQVAIFRGLTEDVGPLATSRLHRRADIRLAELPVYQRQRVQANIAAADLADANRIVRTLREQVEQCRAATSPEASASPTPPPADEPDATSAEASPAPSATSSGNGGSASPEPLTAAVPGCGSR